MHLPRALLAALFLFAPALHAADGSLSFSPASQQRVEVPNFAGLDISNEVTVEFWALSTSAGISQSVFMLNPDTATNRFQSHLNYFNGNTYWDFGDIGNGGRVQRTSQPAWLNNWTHFALTAKSGSGMKIYANGAEVASVPTFNALEDVGALTKLSIGGILNTYFQGNIDDFRIWNIARSEADIRRDMTGPLTGSEAGLRLYFKFDEGSGTTAVNSATATGTAFNGTVMGTTTTGMWSTPARTTYTVTTTADENDTPSGPSVSLREALRDAAAASGPALITFAPALSGQSISLTGPANGTAIDINDAGGVTIDATSLPGGLTINDGTATTFRLLSVASGTSLTLRGLTLANGGGGGFGGFGGAIENSGTLTLTQCPLSGNSAKFGGGAIFNNGGTLALTHCALSGNSANSHGGAIYNTGTLTLTHCTLSGNSADNEGGAIYNSGTLALTQCSLSGNSAILDGGAIHDANTLTLTHCTLSGNSALGGDGGAIFGRGTVTLRHCTVAGNFANGSGGGGGGGVYLSTTLVLENSIVAANTLTGSGTGPDIRIAGGTVNASGANLVQAAIAGSGTVNGSATITVANPRLAPLASNGGPTQTMALLPGSPAIDAAAIIPGLDTDQRGLPRSRDGDATAGAAPDIGAYEAQLAPFSVGFNFVGGRSGVAGGTLNSGDIAGVPAVAQGNWNNLTTDFAGSHAGTYTNGPTPALAADGSAFSPNLRLWWDASSTYTTSGTAPTPATPPNERLMFGYLDSNNSGDGRAATNLRTNATGQPYFAVAGLPAAATLGGYRVLVYADGDAANPASPRKSEYWLTTFRQTDTSNVASEVPLTPSLFIGDTGNFSGTYTRGTGTSAATATEGANYVQFDGLTEPGGFMVRAEEVGFRAPINAVQIVRNEIIVVTTAADENDPVGTLGTGLSLREAIALAPDGAGIVFDPAVFNGEPADTITYLTTNPGLVVNKNLTIDASNIPGGVTINAAASSGNQKSVITVNPARTAALLGLNLTGGYNTALAPGAGGGGLLNRGATTLTSCRLTGNTAIYGGAATSLSFSGPTSLTLRRCTVSGNTAAISGAGLLNWADGGNAADLRVEDSTVTNNTAQDYAGGLYNYRYNGNATFTALRTTVTGNTANYGAGCINANANTSMTLTHCTVSGNTANVAGGGCYNFQGGGPATLTLAHTIVAGNTASSAANGPDIYKQGGTITNAGGNLIGKNDTVTTEFPAGALIGTSAAPVLPLLAPLGNYGGPTQTMALLPGSPARNAATGSTATSDQRGFPIVGTPDIGAYEAGTFTNYNAWAWETIPSTDPAHHAPGYDYDGDGRSLLLEFAGQLSPTTPEGGLVMPFTRDAAGTLATLVMPYRGSVPGLIYTIERSTTLGPWTTVVTVDSGTSVATLVPGVTHTGSTAATLTFTDTFINGQPRVFYRLRVTQP